MLGQSSKNFMSVGAVQCSRALGFYRGTYRRSDEWPDKIIEAREHKHSRDEHKAYLKAMQELKSKKKRGVGVFVENVRLIQDLLKLGHKPSHMFYVEGGAHTDTRMPESCSRIPVTSGQMRTLTDVEAHQGIMCVFARPFSVKINTETAIPLIIYLDDVRDPGNVGTIIRSATGAGCLSVISSPGSCDIFSPKVMRSAAAAQFLIPTWKNREFGEFLESLSDEWKVVVAHKHLGDQSNNKEVYYNQDFTQPTLLVLGNESRGVTQETLKQLPKNTLYTSIPTPNALDSVNVGVAASVLMFEMARQCAVAKTAGEQTAREHGQVVRQLQADFKELEQHKKSKGPVIEPIDNSKVLDELTDILNVRNEPLYKYNSPVDDIFESS